MGEHSKLLHRRQEGRLGRKVIVIGGRSMFSQHFGHSVRALDDDVVVQAFAGDLVELARDSHAAC